MNIKSILFYPKSHALDKLADFSFFCCNSPPQPPIFLGMFFEKKNHRLTKMLDSRAGWKNSHLMRGNSGVKAEHCFEIGSQNA